MKRAFVYIHPDFPPTVLQEYFGQGLVIRYDPLKMRPVLDNTCPLVFTKGTWYMVVYMSNTDLRAVMCTYEPMLVAVEKNVPVVFIGGPPDNMSVALSKQLDTDRIMTWTPGFRVKSAAKHPC